MNMENKNSQKGQSVIEFLLTFTIVIGMLFFYFKMSLGFTNGYMVHYSTFMASRSFLTSDSWDTDPDGKAFQKAQAVFKRLLPEGLINGFNGQLKMNDPDSVSFKVFTGVYADFYARYTVGIVGGNGPIFHRSESFLGREPTRLESTEQTCRAIARVTKNGCDTLVTLDDNGG